ncbi:MAG: pyridoxamine 5'-phosphate oxidase family protein, partial [Chloroflexota bacterium]
GDWLLLHGAPAAGTMRRGRNIEVCVTITLLDGLVLARSAFNHSLNYRSVVVLGTAEFISDEDERSRALDAITERLVPGRGAQLRPTTRKELRQTTVLRVSLERASAKVRSGPPHDEEEDYAWPVWAGVLPINSSVGQPEPDPRLSADIELPANVAAVFDKHL